MAKLGSHVISKIIAGGIVVLSVHYTLISKAYEWHSDQGHHFSGAPYEPYVHDKQQ